MKYVLTDAAVRKLRGVLAPRSGSTGAGGAATPVSPDDFPPPFTVRWAQSENNGSGAWVIWLPDYIVSYRDDFLRPTRCTRSQLLPRHWYIIDDAESGEDEVWLGVKMPSPPDYPAPRVEILTNGSPEEAWNEADIAYRIAQMFTNPNTSSRRVSQQIVSMVNITGVVDSGSVTLDDTSTDYNGDDEVQIKDWDTGTPASATTIAQDIHDGNTTAQGAVPERTTGGALQYKKPGTLAQLTGSYLTGTQAKTVVTNVEWNATNHTLDITKATLTIKDGVILNWVEDVAPTPIQTTSFALLMARA